MKNKCSTLLFILFGVLNTFAQSELKPRGCNIIGKILDRSDLSLSTGDFITFSGALKDITLSPNDFRTDDESFGEYRISLPCGLYSITLRNSFKQKWNYQRAKIELSYETTKLNLYKFPQCVSYGCDKDSEYRFASFSRNWISNKKLNFVIAYGEKTKKKNNLIIYSDTMFTYKNTTILADKITQDFKNKTLLFEGEKTWMEENGERIYAKKITLTFLKDTLTSKIEN
jgi:hypothetical protein